MPLEPAAGPQDRLIVALDFPTAALALRLVDQLEGRCRWVKVGLELFLAAGRSIIDELRRRDLKVFLDLKLHDIPATVAGAVRSVAPLGASLLTLHAAGGPEMLEAARDAAAAISGAPRLLAVTVLTSMNAHQLNSIGVPCSPAQQVLRLGRMGAAAGIPGMVCSPEEVASLRAELGPEPLLVIPGIRPAGSASGDQKRIATPADAVRDGASMLVIGRPITRAANPCQAFEQILAEMSA